MIDMDNGFNNCETIYQQSAMNLEQQTITEPINSVKVSLNEEKSSKEEHLIESGN